EYVDMLAAGIIDPAKVTRSALQNAASIAALFLTTEAVVADKPEKEKAAAGAPGGGDMDFGVRSRTSSPGSGRARSGLAPIRRFGPCRSVARSGRTRCPSRSDPFQAVFAGESFLAVQRIG